MVYVFVCVCVGIVAGVRIGLAGHAWIGLGGRVMLLLLTVCWVESIVHPWSPPARSINQSIFEVPTTRMSRLCFCVVKGTRSMASIFFFGDWESEEMGGCS